MSSFDEIPPSDLGDIVPSEKNDRVILDDPVAAKGPDPKELFAAPMVTDPMTTAPAVFGLNWGMGFPSGPNTATNR